VNIQRAINLARNWRDVLLELRLRSGADYPNEQPLSYEPDPALLKGAYIQWPSAYAYRQAGNWVNALKSGFQKHLPVQIVDVAPGPPTNDPTPILIHVVVNGRPIPVTIDYADYMDRLDHNLLATSALYFKMQYRRIGYINVTPHHEKILPGGYINGSPYLYKYLGYVREHGRKTGYTTDVYGRFGLTFAREIREKAHRLLSEQKHFRYRGGLVRRRYIQFLRECAEARICIDLPSNSDFCFRLTDYLAIGCCVVAPKHRTMMPVDLQDRQNIVYVRPDLDDLVETCRYYLAHDQEREAIRREARLYFDRYLHREQLAGYYLHQCFRALRVAGRGHLTEVAT
jgi:glycosyl transferase family 1